jgi:hypothetical protein
LEDAPPVTVGAFRNIFNLKGVRPCMVLQPISTLVGLSFKKVWVDKSCEYWDTLVLEGDRTFRLEHRQDCCEFVYLDDICGDLKDLEDSPILSAEESSNQDDPPPDLAEEYHQWTFYRLTTAKGLVVLRWLGESNGYYSIGVDLVEEEKDA